MKGLWFWTGNYAEALKLAVRMGANTIFVKVAYHPDYPSCGVPPLYVSDAPQKIRDAHAAGLLVCAEAYIVPRWAAAGGELLKKALGDGADSVCLNAETEWETVDVVPPQQFLAALGPGSLQLCSDIRGSRLSAPYHQTLLPLCDGLHPMVYHRAFNNGSNPLGALQKAFDDTIGKPPPFPLSPTYPVVQGYGGCDYEETLGAVILSHLYGCGGSSVYASHDLNKRAELGVRDGWAIVERLRTPTNPSIPFVGGLTAEQKGRLVAAVQEVLKGF